MPVAFKGSPKPTIGVEVEVQLIDPATLDLKPAAVPILQEAKGISSLRVKSELTQAMVEINTDICHTVAEVEQDLQKQFLKLSELAKKCGAELVVSGTHPFQNWRERQIYPTERYRQIIDKFQWVARRLTIFGLHVHIGIKDGDRAIAVINALINYIPHLLALSASSPFWQGYDTGLQSVRVAVFESLPLGGLPYYLVDWKEFQKYFEALSSTGTIQGIKDIYWDIRPHFDFGTVEVRICDGLPTLKETLALAALIQCLVVWIDSQYEAGKRSRQIHMQRYWLAPENKWQAARYGLEGQVITEEGNQRVQLREQVAALLDTLKPVAQSLKCEKELGFVESILRNGPSSVRQRIVFSQTHSLQEVVRSLMKEFTTSLSESRAPSK